MAILPYYLGFILKGMKDTMVVGRVGKVLRLVRVMRILRVFKVRTLLKKPQCSGRKIILTTYNFKTV